MNPIHNRIEKNHRKLAPWAKRIPTEAWRLYDRDIPEYPYIVDVYKDHFVIYDRSDSVIDAGKNHGQEVMQALKDLFKASDEQLVLKSRQRQEGLAQYERISTRGEYFSVREGKAQFRVNLFDYLDTGLFLDHRPMRHLIYKASKGRKVLNLFCYTGSVSVCAALGGGHVTSIDMSATYLDWAQENFRLNSLDVTQHEFLQADVLGWMEQTPRGRFDLIFLDPPTFSNSKRMNGTLDVERDQEFLVNSCVDRLEPGGVLYFSNNKRGFKISPVLNERYAIQEITDKTIPPDFHDKKIHRCYEIRRRS